MTHPPARQALPRLRSCLTVGETICNSPLSQPGFSGFPASEAALNHDHGVPLSPARRLPGCFTCDLILRTHVTPLTLRNVGMQIECEKAPRPLGPEVQDRTKSAFYPRQTLTKFSALSRCKCCNIESNKTTIYVYDICIYIRKRVHSNHYTGRIGTLQRQYPMQSP